MSRRNLTPEQKEKKLMIREFLKTNPIKDGNDLMALMREMMAEVVEGSLEGEMDEELGYTKYDYRNKNTDNSRNGYSKKNVNTSFDKMEIDIPRDREDKILLRDMLKNPGESIKYIFNLENQCEHRITLEEVMVLEVEGRSLGFIPF